MQHRLVAKSAPAVYAAAGAWLLLIGLEVAGQGGVIRHDRLLQGGPPLWLATLLFVAGWQVMVVAMMVPSSAHAFARVDSARELIRFTSGYLAVWTAFGLAIFLGDVGVHWLVNSWAWLSYHTWVIAGTVLVATGAYQVSGVKDRSLEACRVGPSSNGAMHALECLGASGGLMLLTFAIGAAGLVTMAAFAGLMLFEVSALGRAIVKPVGYVLIALGVVVLYGPIPI